MTAPQHSWEFDVEGDPHEQLGPVEILAAALVARLPPMLVQPLSPTADPVISNAPTDGPVSGVVGLVRATGKSRWTVSRAIADAGIPSASLVFASADEAVAWWIALRSGSTSEPTAARKGRRPRVTHGSDVAISDWTKIKV